MPASFAIESWGEGQTRVHRLDVRTKVGIGLLTTLAVMWINAPAALAILAVASLPYVLFLRKWKILLVVFAAVLLMWCGAVAMMAGLHAIWPASPPLDLKKLQAPFLRTVVMVHVTLPLALSSRIQDVVAVLKALRLPFCIYVPLAVMIRFLPTFIEDVRQVHECLRTRGHRLTPITAIARPMLTLRLLVVPLIFRSLRSSDELGIAAELKGMGSGERMTPLKVPRFKREDAWAAVLALAVLALGAALQIFSRGAGGGMFG
jgi:energy-coupling factor transport system permease protein